MKLFLLPKLNNFFLQRLLSKSTRLSMIRNAVWALSNLCRGKNPPPPFEKVSPCLPVLAHLLNHQDCDVLADACWALSYLSDGPNDKIQAVIDAGVCRRLVELLMWARELFTIVLINLPLFNFANVKVSKFKNLNWIELIAGTSSPTSSAQPFEPSATSSPETTCRHKWY